MTALPNYEQAIIEDSKLVEYALNPQNERGQHKARVFESALAFNLSNWEDLKGAILDALPHHDATFTSENVFGKKYQVILTITGPNGRSASVMTVWQFDRLANSTFANAPRLVTLYIL